MSLSERFPPSRVFARAQSTDSNGCVVCDSTNSSCPDCAADEQCQLTTQTCSQCAQYYCVKKESTSSSSSSGTPIGGIVGGVIGGLAVLALIGAFLYYRLIYRKKHPLSLDDEDMAMSDYDYDYDYDDPDTSSGNIDQKNLDATSTTTTAIEHSASTNNLVSSASAVGLGDATDSGTISETTGAAVAASPNLGESDGAGTNPGATSSESGAAERPAGQRRLNSGGTSSSGNSLGPSGPSSGRKNPPGTKNRSTRRLSSYESFTRPKARYLNGRRPGAGGRKIGNTSYYPSHKTASANARARGNPQRRAQGGANAGNMVQHNRFNVNSNLNSSNRNSVATTISTTNASNILPIAYIPGVTVRPTRNNTRLVYSYESESIFSDLNTIENASIIGDVMRANNHNGVDNPAQEPPTGLTMTAIKAQPRLVNVDRIEEEDEDLTDDEDDDDDLESHKKLSFKNNNLYANSDTLINGSSAGYTNTNTYNNTNTNTISTTLAEEDEDDSDDSDVDSDIGEINRATSINRSNRKSFQEREILIDNDNYDIPLNIITQPQQTDTGGLRDSVNGSFILDVEFDSPQSDGTRSPFDDPSD